MIHLYRNAETHPKIRFINLTDLSLKLYSKLIVLIFAWYGQKYVVSLLVCHGLGLWLRSPCLLPAGYSSTELTLHLLHLPVVRIRSHCLVLLRVVLQRWVPQGLLTLLDFPLLASYFSDEQVVALLAHHEFVRPICLMNHELVFASPLDDRLREGLLPIEGLRLSWCVLLLLSHELGGLGWDARVDAIKVLSRPRVGGAVVSLGLSVLVFSSTPWALLPPWVALGHHTLIVFKRIWTSSCTWLGLSLGN